MTSEQLRGIGPALAGFLGRFEQFFDNPEGVAHFRNYTRGLLSDLDRKTAEPLAVRAGVPPRNVQQFLKACVWDDQGLVDAVQEHLLAAVAGQPDDGLGTVAVIDETSAVKKGDKTPGVQRQYLGCLGKVDNGIVTVHLAAVRGGFKTLLDGELFLPESWSDDRDRCDAADIPKDMRHQPKWLVAFELFSRAHGNGWRFGWMTFDEGYGGKPKFLALLDLTGQQYVGEVPKTFSCRTEGESAKSGAEALFSGPGVKSRRARTFAMPQQTGPATVWQAKRIDVCLGDELRAGHQLIKARNRETGEVKYFIARSNRRTGLRRLLQVGFTRWNVEHLFRVAKGEIGLTHFEGRSYVSLKRHLALCLTAMAFVVLHTMRLQKKNPKVTLEQVGRALRLLCRKYPGRRRGTSEKQCLLDLLNYHQRRNEAAAKSHRKRKRMLKRFAAL